MKRGALPQVCRAPRRCGRNSPRVQSSSQCGRENLGVLGSHFWCGYPGATKGGTIKSKGLCCYFICACLAHSMRQVSPGVEVLGQDPDVRGETVGSRSHQNIVLQPCTVMGSVNREREQMVLGEIWPILCFLRFVAISPGYWRMEDPDSLSGLRSDLYVWGADQTSVHSYWGCRGGPHSNSAG